MRFLAVALVIVLAGSSAYAQCCKKGGSCAAKRAPAVPQASMRPAVPNDFGTRVYLFNMAQAQQVAAQQAFMARQKMIREQKGAAIAAAREAAKQEEPERKPKKAKPKTGASGLLARAAELAEQREP